MYLLIVAQDWQSLQKIRTTSDGYRIEKGCISKCRTGLPTFYRLLLFEKLLPRLATLQGIVRQLYKYLFLTN